MNEDAYYDRLLREYDRDIWADLAREAEERLAAGDIACDRATVTACDSADVEACDSATVIYPLAKKIVYPAGWTAETHD